jgi:hypothetical protein
MAVVHVTVFVGEEVGLQLRPYPLHEHRVVVDDGTAVLEGGHGEILQGIGRDLAHVHQALDRLSPMGSGGQQQRRDDGGDPEPAHDPSRSCAIIAGAT